MPKETGIIWFRNDLRITDHIGLQQAMQKHERIIAVYCFDPRQFKILNFETDTDVISFAKTEKYRTRFLIESVQELRNNLSTYNIPLFVYIEKPEIKIPELINEFKCLHIYSQKEWTYEENQVTEAVKTKIDNSSITWIENYDQFLFHPEDIPFDIENTPQVFTAFRKKLEKYVSVRPLSIVKDTYTQEPINNDTPIPTLRDFGFVDFDTPVYNAFPFKGGETEALNRIQSYFWESKKLSYYKKTRNGLIGTDYSSKLSAWLANGSISAKTIYYEINKYEQEITKNDSTYWLLFELIWRDYFKYISLKHAQEIFKIGGILHKKYNWTVGHQKISAWMNGTTGVPFVDANMLELKQTGWMSNRGRQNVASYFSKDQHLDWRIGAAYFESQLIDYDVHSNYGNWMYVAGVGNDPRDRKFNIKLQAERYDPNHKFQKLWLQPTLF